MISLSSLGELAQKYRDDLDQPVAALQVGGKRFDVNERPVVMGCINLSRDSTYRESVAVSVDAAARRGRVLEAQGADLVDVGAESSSAKAARVSPGEQVALMVPVIERLASGGTLVSAEAYDPAVARAALEAGATMINYTGGEPHDPELFDLAAQFGATVLICYVPGRHVRDVRGSTWYDDMIPELSEHFDGRIAEARRRGVENIAIDPGIGFSFDSRITSDERVHRQVDVLLNTFRLRRLGLPICQALPHAFDLFEDQFRKAEGFFAVIAHLGGCSIFRTHEVEHIVPVLRALKAIEGYGSAR